MPDRRTEFLWLAQECKNLADVHPGLVLCLMLSDQMLTRAQTYEAAIQIFEPFIWTFGDTESVLLSTLLLLVLCC